MRCPEVLRFYVAPFLLWPFFIVTFIALLPVCLIVFIARTSEYLIYHSLYDAEIFAHDDIVWTLGNDENQLLINCCLILDGVLPINEFRKLMDESLIKYQNENGKLLYWKITKRILPGFINYYWVDDDTFDIDEHVYELNIGRVTTKNELHRVISERRTKKLVFKNHTSPWEFILIPYQEGERLKTVIFARLSHAIADGSALAYFLVNRLGKYKDPTENEQMVLKFSQIQKGFTKFDRVLINLRGLWVLPIVQTDLLLSFKDSNPLHVSKATGKKNVVWTDPIDLKVVKSIKNRLKTTVNDVILGCLGKSISDYFVEIDSTCPADISVIFPFDVRSSPDEAKEFNNKFGAMVIRIPTNKTDLISAIQEIKFRMNYVKYSGEPIGSFIGWKFLSYLLPKFIAKFFIFNVANKTTGSVSNLIGPQKTIVIGEHQLDNVIFWSPQTNHHSFGAAFCSYDGQIIMGIESDDAALKDPMRIVKIFEQNINKLACVPQDGASVVMSDCDVSQDNAAFEEV